MAESTAEWRPDPTGRHEYRYWDGEQFTDQVADEGQVATEPMAGPALTVGPILISTMNDVPGYRVTTILGECFGLAVRSADVFSLSGASFRANTVGGELVRRSRNLEMSRRDAVWRMCQQAGEKGANAVIAMRFDASAMGSDWTEICAYGTAVLIEPT